DAAAAHIAAAALLTRLGHASLARANIGRPGALDEGQHGPDLTVGKDVLEPGHVALVARHEPGRADFGHVEQLRVGVMPGVPRRVMRRRRHSSVGYPFAPVRLAFELRPVTGGAMLLVNTFAAR